MVLASLKHTGPIAQHANVPLPAARPKLLALASVASKPASAPDITVAAANLFDARGSGTPRSTPIRSWRPRKRRRLKWRPTTRRPAPAAPAATRWAVRWLMRRKRRRPRAADPGAADGRACAGADLDRLTHSAPAPTAWRPSRCSRRRWRSADRWGSPWLRAALLTPNVSNFLTTSRVAKPDPRWMAELFYTPTRSVLMTFGPDPQYGMVASRFTAVPWCSSPPRASPARRRRRCSSGASLRCCRPLQFIESMKTSFGTALAPAAESMRRHIGVMDSGSTARARRRPAWRRPE